MAGNKRFLPATMCHEAEASPKTLTRGRPMFSVVIPTLQKSPKLGRLISSLDSVDLVGEILVINNAPEPLEFASQKVRILNQSENIFVNPAWNLGAEQARFPWLAILNDDVVLGRDFFSRAAWLLRTGRVGMVGLNKDHVIESPGGIRKFVPASPAYKRGIAFGMAMAMPTRNYVHIPENLKVFYGDDWIFYSQTLRNWTLRNIRIDADVSVTSGAPKFLAMGREEERWYFANQPNTYLSRFGREQRVTRKLLDIAYGLRRMLPG